MSIEAIFLGQFSVSIVLDSCSFCDRHLTENK